MKSLVKFRLQGRLKPPGDKSVGHRLAFLGAVARGRSRLEGFAPGDDCRRTLALVEELGVAFDRRGDVVTIEGAGFPGLEPPKRDLDAGNSGSTARMACGLLAGLPFSSRIVGDESLSRRPFDRVVGPLTLMGGSFETTEGGLPVTIHGGRELSGIDYELPVPSAQVKTAILFATLSATGTTRIREPLPSRDHTEIALAHFGAPIERGDGVISLQGGVPLTGARFRLPGDFSSAAFFIGGASFLPGSDLVVEEVGLNPTRSALLNVLRAMGADITVEHAGECTGGEPVGTLRVRGGALHGIDVPRDKIPALIDELPLLAVAAAFAEGTTRVEGASELRVKESDRLAAIVEGLRSLGAAIEPVTDGFVIHGGRPLRPAPLLSHGDHRMVMAWTIAALGVEGECPIDHLEPVKISYPGFFQTLDRLVS